jgi:hypothetical protein
MRPHAAVCCRMLPHAAETESHAEVLLYSSMSWHIP